MKSLKKLNKIFFVLYLALQVGVGIFLSNLLILPHIASAWEFDASAQAICWLNPGDNVNYVHIKVTFKNRQADNKSMNVVATDNWTGQSVNLGTVAPGQTATGEILTGQKSITNSSVTLEMTWSDGSSDFGGHESITVNYSTIDCPQPTPTPTPTVVPTATPVPPTPTPIPTTPTPTPVGPTPTPRVQVLAARAVTELPKTGAADGILFGLLSLIPTGIIIRRKANKLLF